MSENGFDTSVEETGTEGINAEETGERKAFSPREKGGHRVHGRDDGMRGSASALNECENSRDPDADRKSVV